MMSVLQDMFVSTLILVSSALSLRVFYNLYFHPLSKFPGPWYTSSFSLLGALISWFQIEPQWLESLVKKYGTNSPIRISPTMLLFPKPSALKEIYADPKCNQKSGLYGSGILGPTNLFTTLDSNGHRAIRKAVGGPQWSIGALKNEWETRIDDQVQLFICKMRERAENKESVILSDRLAEFAADIMTMVTFTTPWGFVKNSRDEREMLTRWRKGLDLLGFIGRFRFFRNYIMAIPGLNKWLLPATSDEFGTGFLMFQADKEVTQREANIQQGIEIERSDFLQYCLDSRIDGKPLSPIEKRSHITLLIQAGAEATGTALGSTLRFLGTHPSVKDTAMKELQQALNNKNLSTPIKFEEVRSHLPYFIACVKESLRLQPPATNLFARIVGQEGKTIDGVFVPAGTEITSNAYIVQRDPELYQPDPNSFRPERWLVPARAAEMEASSFVFGFGSRVCLGKDIALMEVYKLLPEIMRWFDVDVIREGKCVVAGGVAYNQDFEVKLTVRDNDS